jgi:hypothetical protein
MTFTLIFCLPLAYFAYQYFSSIIPAELDYGPLAGALFYGVTFTLLWCGYVQFVFSFDTSPSLRVLVVLLDHPEGMTEKEVVERIKFRETFRRRFERAVFGGAILADREGDHASVTYRLAAPSVRLAQVGKAAKKLFRLGPGG